MKFIATLAAGLALACASGSTALAQAHNHGAHAGHGTPAAAPVQAIGVVKSIDARAGSVTIAHDPIRALGWSAMTMAFKADPAVLKAVAPGDKVSFTLKGQQVTAIRKQ
jgi:Cu/Ag efflux protein CusF